MKGSLEEIKFINLAQFFSQNKHTGCLVLWFLGGGEAHVFFESGRITRAQFGPWRGQTALETLARAPQRGRFRFRFGQRADGQNVNATSISVLLSLGQPEPIAGFPIAS